MKGQDIATEHFDYKPFGDTLNADDESRIGYAAQERDEESRYFAMGARQYDPISGRFLSVDPLYESFPDKTPYHYCNNNPISFKDPSGLSPEGEKGKEDEVQDYSGDEELSNVIFNEINQIMEDYRNSMKMQNTYDIDGEAMADASRQRMEDFGGGGQGFNNTGWESIFGNDEGEEADRTGPEGEEVAKLETKNEEDAELIKDGIEPKAKEKFETDEDGLTTDYNYLPVLPIPYGRIIANIVGIIIKSNIVVTLTTNGIVDFPLKNANDDKISYAKNSTVESLTQRPAYTFIPKSLATKADMDQIPEIDKGTFYFSGDNKIHIVIDRSRLSTFGITNIQFAIKEELFHAYCAISRIGSFHGNPNFDYYWNQMTKHIRK